jgi:hypothetical protein
MSGCYQPGPEVLLRFSENIQIILTQKLGKVRIHEQCVMDLHQHPMQPALWCILVVDRSMRL